jgi:very-short-patch-repair endonuclease
MIKRALHIKSKLIEQSTSNEGHLCTLLKKLNIKYDFQSIFFTDSGFFILDFYLPEYSLFIEIDGSQHFTEGHLKEDAIRDAIVQKEGYTVLRLSNTKVEDLELKSLLKLVKNPKKAMKDIPILKDTEIITFGKFKNFTVNQILNEDRTYLIWLYRSMLYRFSFKTMRKLNLA